MKDSKGHGSDSHGMANRQNAGNHQAGVLRLGRPLWGPAPNGTATIEQRDQSLPGWRGKVVTGLSNSLARPEAKAERIAMRMQADNKRFMRASDPNTKMRVRIDR